MGEVQQVKHFTRAQKERTDAVDVGLEPSHNASGPIRQNFGYGRRRRPRRCSELVRKRGNNGSSGSVSDSKKAGDHAERREEPVVDTCKKT